MPKEKWEQVCPFCQSEKITVDKDDKLVMYGMTRGYVCTSCKRTFKTPLEMAKEE